MTAKTINFATNRKPNKLKPTNFGKGFSRDGLGDLRFGQANVIAGTIDKSSIKVFYPMTQVEGHKRCSLI